MIVLDTEEFADYFNKKIHSFLTTEFFEMRDPDDPYDSLDLFFPSYLLREQKDKCLSTALDLYYWSGDTFKHSLTPFHQYGLYNFLQYVEDYRNDDRQLFDHIYYNNAEDVEAIKKEWGLLNKEDYEEVFTTIKGFRKFMHDIGMMIDLCFDDIDFITFPYLLGNTAVNKMGSVPSELLEDYSDLLPRDIAKHYQQLHEDEGMSLFDDLRHIFDELVHNVKYKSHYKLFWNDKMPLRELDVHTRLEAILMAYFQRSEVVIDREVDIGTGKIDFRLSKYPLEKVLVEVKLASSRDLARGLVKQLAHYMDAEKTYEAYYIVICYTEEEVQESKKLLGLMSEIPNKRIDVKILDASRKITASKLR